MKYKVKILEEPFNLESEEHDILPRASTVLVTTTDNEGETKEEKYGFVDREEVYSLIDSGQKINLNHCYIAGFSLSEYRKRKGLDGSVSINLCDARNAFFDTGESFERAIGREIYPDKNVSSYKNVDFIGANFGDGDIDFSYAKFGKGNVKFGDVKFGDGNIVFIGTEFGKGEVYFSIAKFGDGNVDFRWANFGDGDVLFNFVNFGKGKVHFSGAKFGELYFVVPKFGEIEILFDWTYFGMVKFSNLNIFEKENGQTNRVTIVFSNCIFKDSVDMQYVECNELRIYNCTIEKIVKLQGLKVNRFSLTDTINFGQIFIRWKEEKLSEVLTGESAQDKADQLVMLKENFHSIGRYDDEDMAYVEYRRSKRKATCEEVRKEKGYKKISGIYKYFLVSMDWLIDWLSMYATNPWRVASRMAVFFTVFTGIYLLFPELIIKSDKISQPYFWKCISYSIATFLTIGYGNITPLTWVAVVLSGFEGFLGVFLTALFTVAFARKVLR